MEWLEFLLYTQTHLLPKCKESFQKVVTFNIPKFLHSLAIFVQHVSTTILLMRMARVRRSCN